MKDLKNLKIRVKSESELETLKNIAKKLGLSLDLRTDFYYTDGIALYFWLLKLKSLTGTYMESTYNEITNCEETTIEELTEMVRLHEGEDGQPVERVTLKDTGWMPEWPEEVPTPDEYLKSVLDKLSILEKENKELRDLVKDCVDLVDNCTNRDNAVFTLDTIREKIYKTLKAKQLLNQ